MSYLTRLPISLRSVAKTLTIVMAGSWWALAESPATMPSFNLPDLDGKPFNSSQLMGKAVVIDFWATWCTTCKETVPKLIELNDKYKDKGLVVIGISVDKGAPEKVKKAALKLGMNYILLHDKENSLSKSFGFSGIPSVYVFDRSGKLKTGMPGYDPDQDAQLVAAAEKAMAGQAAPVMEKAMEEHMSSAPENTMESSQPAASGIASGDTEHKKTAPVKTKKKATSSTK